MPHSESTRTTSQDDATATAATIDAGGTTVRLAATPAPPEPTPATKPATEAVTKPATEAATEAAETTPVAGAKPVPAAPGPLRAALGRTRAALLPSPNRPGGGDGADADRPGRLPRPVRAGALIGGLVLVTAAFAVATVHGDDPKPPHRTVAGNPLGGDPNTGDTGVAPNGVPAPRTSTHPAAPGHRGDPGTSGTPKSAAKKGTPGAAAKNAAKGAAAGSGSAGAEVARREARAATPTTWTGVTGPDCGSSYARVGSYFNGGHDGWLHHGSGCGDKYDALPESGDAGSADSSLYSIWRFSTGPVSTGHCSVSVYVPDSSDIRYVGGAPAHYVVSGAGTDTVTIDQPSHRGQWVGAGSYPVSRATMTVRLTNQGQDWSGGKKTYRHVAAAAIKLDCTTA